MGEDIRDKAKKVIAELDRNSDADMMVKDIIMHNVTYIMIYPKLKDLLIKILK
jgi:hypothetical protein